MNDLKEQVEILTKEKGQLEALVQQLQDEKRKYLVSLQTTLTPVTKQKEVLASQPTKSVATFESAELVDMPSEVTCTPSQLLASAFLVWWLVHSVLAATLTLSLTMLFNQTTNHSVLTSSTVNHHLKRPLIFLSPPSHRFPLAHIPFLTEKPTLNTQTPGVMGSYKWKSGDCMFCCNTGVDKVPLVA